jgi:hypothetical protein
VRSGDTEGEDGVIEVMSAHGHHARRIGPGTAPVYSPHGRWLAYADTNNDLRSTGLHITDLRSSAIDCGCPAAWAPTGSSTTSPGFRSRGEPPATAPGAVPKRPALTRRPAPGHAEWRAAQDAAVSNGVSQRARNCRWLTQISRES